MVWTTTSLSAVSRYWIHRVGRHPNAVRALAMVWIKGSACSNGNAGWMTYGFSIVVLGIGVLMCWCVGVLVLKGSCFD